MVEAMVNVDGGVWGGRVFGVAMVEEFGISLERLDIVPHGVAINSIS